MDNFIGINHFNIYLLTLSCMLRRIVFYFCILMSARGAAAHSKQILNVNRLCETIACFDH
jgi:hypothetical protein